MIDLVPGLIRLSLIGRGDKSPVFRDLIYGCIVSDVAKKRAKCIYQFGHWNIPFS